MGCHVEFTNSLDFGLWTKAEQEMQELRERESELESSERHFFQQEEDLMQQATDLQILLTLGVFGPTLQVCSSNADQPLLVTITQSESIS